jgi:uncharacterized membrane protein YcaP (DUF421 family)
MNALYSLWGSGEQLTAVQMAIRAIITFLITLVLIRVGGVRIFGKRSGFDTIIMITMGSVLARGIVGASPFWSAIAAATAMIAVHRLLGWLCIKSRAIESLIKGKQDILYKNGKIIPANLKKASLTEMDLEESLRLETRTNSFEKVKEAFIETNGRISFIMKEDSVSE